MRFGKPVPPVVIVAIGIAVSVFLLHAQIANALVMRGDDFLLRNALRDARVHYIRALWLDPQCAGAIDRLIYLAVLQKNEAQLDWALAISSDYLHKRPRDPVILADRGLAYLVAKRYREAEADFAKAGQSGGGLQDRVFARRLALVLKERMR